MGRFLLCQHLTLTEERGAKKPLSSLFYTLYEKAAEIFDGMFKSASLISERWGNMVYAGVDKDQIICAILNHFCHDTVIREKIVSALAKYPVRFSKLNPLSGNLLYLPI
jgi:hypothetical protein